VVKFSNISALCRTRRPILLALPILIVGLTAGSALASPLGSVPAAAGASAPV